MTRRKPLQCKHIPDAPVLQFLAGLRWTPEELADVSYPEVRTVLLGKERGGTWFTAADGSLFANSVQQAMPPGVPEKLALAKMRMLERRGLIDGCTCGCRGDFRLTGKGHEYLRCMEAPTS